MTQRRNAEDLPAEKIDHCLTNMAFLTMDDGGLKYQGIIRDVADGAALVGWFSAWDGAVTHYTLTPIEFFLSSPDEAETNVRFFLTCDDMIYYIERHSATMYKSARTSAVEALEK